MIRLLAAAVALLALLVLGLGVTALVALRTVSRVEAALGGGEDGSLGQLQQALAQTGKLADDLTRRQEAAGAGLARVAGETAARINRLEARLKALEGTRAGAMDKLNQMIELQQLLAHEQMALLQHTVETQEVLALAARPLPAQKELTQPPAYGGGGSAGEAPAPKDPKKR